ncbi:MAG TPA: amidase family protein, partial [Pseudogracilibacillus sp.]|nr:amidase family protein [Pseudogracilibacillus sp.]
MKVTEYMKCDAVKLASLLEKKEVTQEEVIEASFSRLDEVESILEATTYTRKEKALHEVEEVEARPFRGVPLYLKDSSQAIAGELIQSGATLLQDQKAHETANFVKALYKAGFVSVGQSKAPEFSLKNITEPILYGSVCNPWNVAHSPGGSSGGAAALVASGVVPIAGASDGGGSIRIPASFTSL